jgi:hypothetical protein
MIIPYMKNGRRDYKRENALYNSRPENVKKRVERNAARRELEKKGEVSKGDGKDVDHKTPLSKGGRNTPSNLRAVPAKENRSFSRNADGSLKSQRSKRESKRK